MPFNSVATQAITSFRWRQGQLTILAYRERWTIPFFPPTLFSTPSNSGALDHSNDRLIVSAISIRSRDRLNECDRMGPWRSGPEVLRVQECDVCVPLCACMDVRVCWISSSLLWEGKKAHAPATPGGIGSTHTNESESSRMLANLHVQRCVWARERWHLVVLLARELGSDFEKARQLS